MSDDFEAQRDMLNRINEGRYAAAHFDPRVATDLEWTAYKQDREVRAGWFARDLKRALGIQDNPRADDLLAKVIEIAEDENDLAEVASKAFTLVSLIRG